MKKQEIIIELKSRCNKMLNINKKFEHIKDILEEEDCFNKIDVKTALNLLTDLGYDEKMAYAMFEILISK